MIAYDATFLRHVASPGHVESPDRLESIVGELKRRDLWRDIQTPTPATRDDLERVHASTYLDVVETLGDGSLDPDTPIHPETWDIAALAAGAALRAAQSCLEGSTALALVRPPGHHAGPDYGGGFCYINNVAVAAAHLVSTGRRVAVLDYDAHHGNGTCDIFWTSPRVLYVSTHEFGIFPGTGPAEATGKGEGRGFTVNIPFRSRSGDASYALARERLIDPIVRAFRPEAVVVSLGVDAHYLDPLTSLTLSSPGYHAMTEHALGLARDLCGGRIAFCLEGGYHLRALAEVVAGVAASMSDMPSTFRDTQVRDTKGHGLPDVEAAETILREYWPLRG